MLTIYLYAFGSVLVVSLVSLVGIVTLSLQKQVLHRSVMILVSLAVGALLGDAFIYLIPEAFEAFGNAVLVSSILIVSIFVFFVLEKFLHWHHHARGEEQKETVHTTGRMILISDGVHNFIDGLIIGGSYLVGIEVGIATTLAVLLHEIPQEMGDFGVLIYAGYTKVQALWYNFLSATAAFAGVATALLASGISDHLALWLLPFAAGGFIYIAMSDLVPALHKTTHVKDSLVQLVAVSVGVAAMFMLLLVE